MLFYRSDPFRALAEFQRALDTHRGSDWLGARTMASGAYPPINIFRKGEDYVAIVELPGVDKADLDIEAKDNVIRLSGRKTPSYPEKASTHRRERVFGTFDRTISVPVKIDEGKLKAEYRDGILALFIPRAEEDKPRKIEVA